MAKPSKRIQIKAINQIKDFLANSKDLSELYKFRMLEVYRGWSTFKGVKSADWKTAFKVNKAHQIVETVLPRLTARDPRWIVSNRMPDVNPEYAIAIQDYLTYIFDEYNLLEPIRLWAKSMIIYGNAYAEIDYKFETTRLPKTDNPKNVEKSDDTDKEDDILEETQLKDEVTGEYPTICNISWTDISVDPRFTLLEDMPGISRRKNAVRLSDLKRKDEYFNLDQIEQLGNLDAFKDDENAYKQRVFQITGINTKTTSDTIDINSLTVERFYGIFNPSENNEPKKERLYEIHVVDSMVVIKFKEISFIPFEDIKAFDDPEQHFATGFVEPILEMQEELNFKKNSASSYINNSLNRSWLWSPQSGVNPKNLISKPNNIIVASQGVQRAKQELEELPHRTISPDFFQEQNDMERQIQSMSFTVDTSNQRNQQALTNTATGARIKFFESNSVLNEVRKHFEKGLERLAYKLLQSTFENLEDNIVIKKQGTEGFWQLNKELLKDAITKYSIKIEANSSAFDDIENRREEAIAFWNILLQGSKAGVVTPDAMREGLKEVIQTFEKKDVNKFIGTQPLDQFLQGQQGGQQGGQPIGQPNQQPSSAEDITKQVAGGQLTLQ